MTESSLPGALLRMLKPRLPQMLSALRTFVLAESPSLEKSPADRCCTIIAEEWRKHGARVDRLAQKHRGDHLRITWQASESQAAGQLLLLGHYDTGYATRALPEIPFPVADRKAHGPRTFAPKGRSVAVFVLEPSLGARGLLKTARKAVGEAEIIVHGRASHAGLAPEQGVNAVHELARQIGRLEQWNDLRRGISVNADVIEGGTRVNVIAARARAVIH